MKKISKDRQQQVKASNLEKSKLRKKYKDACYVCGKIGHWRKKCPDRQLGQKTRDHTHQKVRATHTTGSIQTEETLSTEATTKKVRAKKKKLAKQPEYYNPDPMARLFGKTNPH